MFIRQLKLCVLASVLCLSSTQGHNCNHRRSDPGAENDGILNLQSLAQAPAPKPLVTLQSDQASLPANTTTVTAINVSAAAAGETIDAIALVIARDQASAYSAYSGLNDRGIPYALVLVPSTGTKLPTLNNSATHGNFGLIVVLSEVSYNYGATQGYQSALTPAQWKSLYQYQIQFGVRMVRLDVAPSADTGTQSLGGCCTGEQLVSISNASAFPGAGLRVGAGVGTKGLYHYPAKIVNPKIAIEFAQFGPATADNYTTNSTAAVINNIDGREQMVFFTTFSTQWSLASTLLQHAWIQWATRGLYVGYRRAMLSTQVDDMFLETPMFDSGENFRVSVADMNHAVEHMKSINSRLNPGSKWFLEIGHNGNGNIEKADKTTKTGVSCTPGPIEYGDQIDTALEFAKPKGTGSNLWPASSVSDYGNYSLACMQKDPLFVWWQKTSNLNEFAHVSHTFSHEDENNATYFDVFREITWNKGWLAASGISAAKMFSGTGIIPPAITGLHNGDALQAWADNGIVHVVGDNTRKPLLNTVNEHWPLISTVQDNGYAGIQITPRWASNIYYNCNYADCVLAEWRNVSKGVGDIYDILNTERDTSVRHLLGLHHDPFMFHQANLMFEDADMYTMSDDITTVMTLQEVWMEYVVREYIRLVDWPLISLKHDDIAASFRDRMTRDNCKPYMSYSVDVAQKIITSVTVSTSGSSCPVPIPVTFPGSVKDTKGATVEQLGNDPLILWVTFSGKPVTFDLKKPLPL